MSLRADARHVEQWLQHHKRRSQQQRSSCYVSFLTPIASTASSEPTCLAAFRLRVRVLLCVAIHHLL